MLRELRSKPFTPQSPVRSALFKPSTQTSRRWSGKNRRSADEVRRQTCVERMVQSVLTLCVPSPTPFPQR